MIISKRQSDKCVICHDVFSIEQKEFTHRQGENHDGFHEACLIEWTNRSSKCPICTKPIGSSDLVWRIDALRRISLRNVLFASLNAAATIAGGVLGVFVSESMIEESQVYSRVAAASGTVFISAVCVILEHERPVQRIRFAEAGAMMGFASGFATIVGGWVDKSVGKALGVVLEENITGQKTSAEIFEMFGAMIALGTMSVTFKFVGRRL